MMRFVGQITFWSAGKEGIKLVFLRGNLKEDWKVAVPEQLIC